VLAAMARVLSTDEVTYSLLALAMAIALTSATDVDASSNSAPDLMRVGHDCVFLQGTLDSLQLGSPISDDSAMATPTTSEPAVSASPAAVSTNAVSACDADGDQLSDAEEDALGTNPLIVDTDGDGLSDTTEHLGVGTSPLISDTDGDGHSDGVEIGNGSDPNDPASPLPGE